MGAKPPRRRSPTRARSPAGKVGEAAFDDWLARELKRLYGDATSEPLPRELLDLIEEDRAKPKPTDKPKEE